MTMVAVAKAGLEAVSVGGAWQAVVVGQRTVLSESVSTKRFR